MLKGVPLRHETLTERGLAALLAQVRRMGTGRRALHRAAKAAGFRPSDVWLWYNAGQRNDCASPLYAALAWEVDQIRAERAAKNAERVEAAADRGEPWAIQRLDDALDAEPWEVGVDEASERALLGELIDAFCKEEDEHPRLAAPIAVGELAEPAAD